MRLLMALLAYLDILLHIVQQIYTQIEHSLLWAHPLTCSSVTQFIFENLANGKYIYITILFADKL